MSDKSLSGAVALVTGAGSGIGVATARRQPCRGDEIEGEAGDENVNNLAGSDCPEKGSKGRHDQHSEHEDIAHRAVKATTLSCAEGY